MIERHTVDACVEGKDRRPVSVRYVPYAECSESQGSQHSPSVLPYLQIRDESLVSSKLSSVSNPRDILEKQSC